MRQVEAAQLMQAERLQRSTIGVGEIVAHDQRRMILIRNRLPVWE